MRLHYNKKFRVTRIETVESNPTEFADRVRDILTSNVRLETEFQTQVYNLIKEKLDPYNISVGGIDRHNFQEVYYLRSANGDVKLQIFYDGDSFVKKIALVGYSHLEAVAAVRTALEI